MNDERAQAFFDSIERRCARSWEEDIRAARRTGWDLLKAYEARTSASFEPGTPEHEDRVHQARRYKARLETIGDK